MSSQIEALVECVKLHVHDLRLVMLFGSFASGRQRHDSDIDLAFAAARPLNAEALLDLKLTLQEACNRALDLVDLNAPSVSIVLKNEVIKFGRILYAADGTAFSEVEGPIRREAEDFLFRRRDLDSHFLKQLRDYATA